MKHKNFYLILIATILGGCANFGTQKDGTVIIDPSYDFIAPNSSNRISSGTYIDFKVTKNENGNISGYLLNNIFNADNNVILFQMGDKIEAKYTFNKSTCSLINFTITNSSNYKLPITDYYLLKNGVIFNCDNKLELNGFPANNEYGIKVISVNNVSAVTGGVTVPDITSNYETLDTSKQYKIIAANKNTLSFTPEFVADNGIQTILKIKSTSIHQPYYVNENKKLIPANFVTYNKVGYMLMVIDGVYSNITMLNNSNESYGEVHLLRAKTPDSNNTLVKNLYLQKSNFYKQSSSIQSDYNQTIYKTNNDENQNVNVQKYNLNQNNDDIAISQASKISKASTTSSQAQSKQLIGSGQTKTIPYQENTPPINTTDQNDNNPMGVSIMKQLNFN